MKHLITASLIAASLLTAPPVGAEPEDPSRGPTSAVVYAEPLGAAAFAVADAVYLPIGALVPLGDSLHLVLEVTPTIAAWHPCNSESTGAFVKVGLRQPLGYRSTANTGFFIQPRLGARYLSTDQGSETGIFGCSAEGAVNVEGSELELSLGADLGYQWTLGSFYVATVAGLSAGYCHECVGGSQPVPIFHLGLGDAEPRSDSVTVGVNLNLLQLGLAF